MYIEDILSTEQSEYISSLTRKNGTEKDEESGGSSLPVSWGSDTVSISKEARAAQQSSSTADQNEDAESEEEGDAASAFGAYMAKSRGATSSDSTDKLEALQSKLQQLQAKKSQILSAGGVSDEAKEAQASGIDAQINQVMSEIAELQAQAAAA